MSRFGDELRRLREEKGLSQQSLATAAGITQGAIGHVERGLRDSVGAEVLFKLSAALGVDCSHFAPYFAEEPPAISKNPKKRAKK